MSVRLAPMILRSPISSIRAVPKRLVSSMSDTLDEWFAREICAHEAALTRYIARTWPKPDEVPDLRHEVYIRVLEAAAQARPRSPKSFLFATTRHLLADRARRNRNRIVSMELLEDIDALNVLIDDASPERVVGARQQLRRLSALIEALPKRCREVVWLRKVEDLSQRQIAERLGIAQSTVEKHVSVVCNCSRTAILERRKPRFPPRRRMTLRTRRNMESSAQAHEAAAHWLTKRDSGQWTPEDEAQFNEWLQLSTGHRVAVFRLQSAWNEASRMKAFAAGHAQERGARNKLRIALPTRVHLAVKRSWAPLALAAGVLVVIAQSLFWPAFESGSAYETPVGGVASVPIADGSTVVLNTDSEIRVKLTPSERRIELSRGEAFFEVAHDPRRPFIVDAGEKRIVAVGTAFSVRRSDGQSVEVIVTDGRVRIEQRRRRARSSLPEPPLAAGAIARITEGGLTVEEKPPAQVQEHLSWRSGFVIFRETPLREAVAELNRYSTRKILISDASLDHLRIGGTFRSTNIDAFVRLLQQGLPVDAQIQTDQIILTARR